MRCGAYALAQKRAYGLTCRMIVNAGSGLVQPQIGQRVDTEHVGGQAALTFKGVNPSGKRNYV
jgi:hypothetical protein